MEFIEKTAPYKPRRRNMKSRILASSLAVALFFALTIPPTISYFIAKDSEVNTFTAGNVSVDAITSQANCANIGYGETCTETITVENTGSVSAYVRVEVWVPTDTIALDSNDQPIHYSLSSSVPADFGMAETSTTTRENTSYNVYTFTRTDGLAAEATSGPITISLTNHQMSTAQTSNVNANECVGENTTCVTSSTSSLVNAGVEVYVKAIQANGFLSASEAFTHYQ